MGWFSPAFELLIFPCTPSQHTHMPCQQLFIYLSLSTMSLSSPMLYFPLCLHFVASFSLAALLPPFTHPHPTPYVSLSFLYGFHTAELCVDKQSRHRRLLFILQFTVIHQGFRIRALISFTLSLFLPPSPSVLTAGGSQIQARSWYDYCEMNLISQKIQLHNGIYFNTYMYQVSAAAVPALAFG